jgi:hypothetical protein
MKQAILLICTFLLVSCAPTKRTPLSCDQVVDPRIASTNWDLLDKTNLQEWVKKTYPGSSVRTIALNTFGWEIGETQYSVVLNPTLERVIIYESNPRPSLREVILCHGLPKWFEARKIFGPESPGVRFTVWYPESGLQFGWEEYGRWIPTELTEDTVFRTLIVTKPGTLDEQVERIAGTAFKSDAMKTIKPWPSTTPVMIKAN